MAATKVSNICLCSKCGTASHRRALLAADQPRFALAELQLRALVVALQLLRPSQQWYGQSRTFSRSWKVHRLHKCGLRLQPAINETVASIAYSDEWRALEEHLSEVDKL